MPHTNGLGSHRSAGGTITHSGDDSPASGAADAPPFSKLSSGDGFGFDPGTKAASPPPDAAALALRVFAGVSDSMPLGAAL